MYRISNSKGSYKLVQKIVSGNLAHQLRLCLGEPDEYGNLSDTKRAAAFMENVWYLKPLVGKTAKIGEGMLKKEYPWEEVTLSRYSDILAKLEDTRHEYTFDEFGEGLVFALVEIGRSGSKEYLYDYGTDPYDFEHEYVEFTDDGEEDYKALKASVKEFAKEFLPEVLSEPEELDVFEKIKELLNENQSSFDDFCEIFAEMYSLTILRTYCYLDEDLDEEAMDIALESTCFSNEEKEFIKDEVRDYFLSPICWDYDYEEVMGSLSLEDKLDEELKTVLTTAGFTLKNYRELFSGKDEAYVITEEVNV